MLLCVFTYAQAQYVSLGTNKDNAPQIADTVRATVADGTANYFKIAAENLPATVYYWADTVFGPLPTLVNVAGTDTVQAQMIADGCRMGWRWQLAAAASEQELRCLYFSAHESGATAEIRPYICHPTMSETTETACDSLYWNGEWRKQTGTYTYHATNAAGCDSTATLRLTVNPSYRITLPDVVSCDSYLWGDTMIYDSGTYTRYLRTQADCDSIVTLNVTIHVSSDPTVERVTAYDSYTWINGTTYTRSITGPSMQLENAAGCDSLVTLVLTIKHLQKDTMPMTVCATEVPLAWYGMSLTESGLYTTDTIRAAETDTLHSIRLTVNPTYAVDTTAVACESFSWYGQTYTESGVQTHMLSSVAGCDSLITLHLTIHHRTTGDTVAGSCDPMVWYEHTCETTGDYVHTFMGGNKNGCDSMLTLHFTRYEPTAGDTIAKAYDWFRWYGETYTESGDYQHLFAGGNSHGCDSVVTLHLTVSERPVYDTVLVYYCPKSGIEEHIDSTSNPMLWYKAYGYEKPQKEWYMTGVVTDEISSGANVDFLKAEQALEAHYVEPLTPVTAIYWRYRERGASSQTEVVINRTQPQWMETGTISVEVHFQCGQRYYDSFTVGDLTEGLEQAEEQGQAVKRIENGQVVILRGGKKYTLFGTVIE